MKALEYVRKSIQVIQQFQENTKKAMFFLCFSQNQSESLKYIEKHLFFNVSEIW